MLRAPLLVLALTIRFPLFDLLMGPMITVLRPVSIRVRRLGLP